MELYTFYFGDVHSKASKNIVSIFDYMAKYNQGDFMMTTINNIENMTQKLHRTGRLSDKARSELMGLKESLTPKGR
jgi:hypothetical protein